MDDGDHQPSAVMTETSTPARPTDIAAILRARDLLSGAALERVHRLEAESGSITSR